MQYIQYIFLIYCFNIYNVFLDFSILQSQSYLFALSLNYANNEY